MRRDDRYVSRGKKRKRHDRSDEQGGFQGVAQFTRQPEQEPEPTLSSSQKKDDSGGEWQTVKSKKQKKRNYPELAYSDLHRLQRMVTLSDLQGLILYCVAGGPAPQWVSVRHHHDVRKAVIIFVPGFEKGLFDGSIPLSEPLNETRNAGDNKKGDSVFDSNAAKPVGAKAMSVTNNYYSNRFHHTKPFSPDNYLPTKLNPSSLPDQLKPLAEMFPHTWPIKAPGDDMRLHSPLQGMLQSVIPKSQQEKQIERSIKGAKPVHGLHHWVNQKTSVVQYTMKSEDLLENDYVLHPSCWESAGLDVEKEKERRRTEKQTADDGWIDVEVSEDLEPEPQIQDAEHALTAGRQVLALDCEMCTVQGGESALTRISVLDWSGTQLMDELVKPSLPIIDYLTPYSGITPAQMAPVTTTLSDIQSRLKSLITPSTILVGHSLNSDLTALKLTHTNIIDTSLLYPHPRGPPMKSSLKWLSQKYLNREIQRNHGTTGHNSIEDARAVLDLVKLKCERGPRWGTPEANSEPVFKRLRRSSKAGASDAEVKKGCIIDWGDPGGNYGKMADFAIGCENDDDVVAAVSRAVKGDVDGNYIPGGGIALTWARMRELEQVRGWRNDIPIRPPASPAVANNDTDINGAKVSSPIDAINNVNDVDEAKTSSPTSPTTKNDDPPTLASTLTSTVTRIQNIRASLPPCTLLVIYSGTGDPRPMRELTDRKRVFQREFKTRNYHEIADKWTDVEEQALRAAVAKAREGVGLVAIV